jgi:hypothetical protein
MTRLILDHEVNLLANGDGPAEERVKIAHLRECPECLNANYWWHRLPEDDPRWLDWCDLIDLGFPHTYKLYQVWRLPEGFPKRHTIRGKPLKEALDWGYRRLTTPTLKSLEWGFEIIRNPYNIMEIEESKLSDNDDDTILEKGLALIGERLIRNNL